MPPSLRDLEHFLEVVDAGSISRAAERVGLRQPSLTAAIQRLEASVGTSLLTRTQRGVSLTAAGKRLAERAPRLRDDWLRLRDFALAARHEVAGRYVIGCHPTVAAYTLPLCLPALLERYPELRLSLWHDLSRKVVEAVISSRVDLGIAVNPVRHPDLVIRRVARDRVTLWRSPTHRKPPDVLLCDPELLQTQTLLRKLGPRARVIESSSLEVIARLTASGAGTGLLPTRLAVQHRLQPVDGAPTVEDELCLVYRAESRGLPAITALAAAVTGALSIENAYGLHRRSRRLPYARFC
jgi:DNA-binding transcriptional LysR family regulator